MLFSDVCLPSLEPSLYNTRGYRLHDEVGDVGLGVALDKVLKHNPAFLVLVKLEHSNDGVAPIGNGLKCGAWWLLFGPFAVGS